VTKAYVLAKLRHVSHMKLQKLVYYAQAWSLVWDERPLFRDRIEAWANGPVIPNLYYLLQGKFRIVPGNLPDGNPEALTKTEKDTVDRILAFYGAKDPQWLSDLTHMEAPWRDARAGLPAGARCNNVISPASMADYYGSL
jgi:uncharacterized phage-associated protein